MIIYSIVHIFDNSAR